MAKKVTTKDFIRRAREVHGDRYDYSKVEYKRGHDHVTIICSEHGEFRQSPSNHIHKNNKRGCPVCGGSKSHTTESFIKSARKVHGDRYDYSQVKYTNNKAKITVICPKHGSFTQITTAHLKGHGCPECGGCKRHDTESFIKKAREVHGDKYDYIKTVYKTAHKEITVICPNHGEFITTPSNHFAGKGCKLCGHESASRAKTSTNEAFIKKARAIHGDKYNYDLVNYKRNSIKITIICPIHGEFQQIPSDHLSGFSCNQCGIDATAKVRTKSTQEFIKDAINVHGDKYDYRLVEYKKARETVTIICPIHGVFKQAPASHTNKGSGCPTCKETGFDSTKPAILYYLKIMNGVAYKIGITNRSIVERFGTDMEYIEVLKTWYYKLGSNAQKEETRILREFKQKKYCGQNILKSGNTELFKSDVLGFDTGYEQLEFDL
ncbi:DUF723 domain-containing protein [Arcobacteraceae bacterium]|nr:DUF723 domain-containing protein [Arcobacteraceae bacterium]